MSSIAGTGTGFRAVRKVGDDMVDVHVFATFFYLPLWCVGRQRLAIHRIKHKMIGTMFETVIDYSALENLVPDPLIVRRVQMLGLVAVPTMLLGPFALCAMFRSLGWLPDFQGASPLKIALGVSIAWFSICVWRLMDRIEDPLERAVRV